MRRLWRPTRKVETADFVTVPGQNRNGAATYSWKGHTFPMHSYAQDWSLMLDLGRDVFRAEVRQGENAYFDARGPATRDRAEFSWESPTYAHGADIWSHGFFWAYPFTGAIAGASQQPIVFQHHDTGDAGDAGGMAPPVSLIWTGTALRMQWAYSLQDPFAGSVTAGSKTVGNVAPGRWYNVLMRTKVNANALLGEVDVWLDGALADPDANGYTYRGSLGTPNVDGVYWKAGIYRFTDTPTIAIAWQGLTVSTTSLLARKDLPAPAFLL
jgi:hypothetical protein